MNNVHNFEARIRVLGYLGILPYLVVFLPFHSVARAEHHVSCAETLSQ